MRHYLLPGIAAATVVAVGGMVWLWMAPSPHRDRRTWVELPANVNEWTARQPTSEYDSTTIFDYIDGHAEVYLAYGLRRCLTRRYVGPAGEADIVLDLFELASPQDAFGVATYDRDGTSVPVGRDALLRHGWLSFWQGGYFVSVLSERETERSREAVLELGRTMAARLPDRGGVPAIVSALPADGLQPREVRYLRHPQILNTHVFVADENLVGLGPTTAAALGRYVRGDRTAHLLVVEYSGPDEAAEVQDTLQRHFALSERGGPTAVGDRGWFATDVRGRRLALAIDAGSADLAATLVRQALDMEKGGTP